ncbi:hypothetical protein L873DRAFT_1846732 [Choiromyces venosus 120613-1]|uniref:Uncharacterized protein n=1 Tax=Choiromyces venosus 120613-1 TaxID=1336337 RepID=A0A3N4JC23_9PEZI|nr:hypothetical protein L873DRAFT_1846732 [Choiromyces venosus 120613-1]
MADCLFFDRASESIVTEFIDYMTMRGRYGQAEFWDTVSAISTDARGQNLEPDVFMVWDLMGSRSERSNLAFLATRPQDDTILLESPAITIEEDDILSPEDFVQEAHHWLDDMPNPVLQDELTEDFVSTLDDLFDQHSDLVYDLAWAHGQERVWHEEDFFSVTVEFLEGDNIDEVMRREVLQATEGYWWDV